MSRPVMPEAPEMLSLKLRLSLDTDIDECQLADWIRVNVAWLNDCIISDLASDPAHPDYGHDVSASLRIEFKRRTAVRVPESQLAPVIPAEPPHTSRPVAGPAGTFLQRVWRRFR